jgi:uncharacterized Zn finger protein
MGSVGTVKNRLLFDIDALRELAGEKTFARGEMCFHDGQISIASLEPKRVLAHVAGPEDCRCVLTGRGKKIGGACSCPIFEVRGFCKHLVATALAANDADPEQEINVEAAFRRIRRYLHEKDGERLVDMVVEAAELDAGLFHKLNLAATAAYGDESSIGAQLRNSIDGAITEQKIVDVEEARRWATGVKAALDNVAKLASGPRAAHALELAERAMVRIARARLSLGDAGYICDELLRQVRNIHVAAVVAVRPEPVELARNLFAREMECDNSIFAGAAGAYDAALGDEGLAEYRRLAVEAWEKLPALGRNARTDSPERYDRLLHILDFFAERAGDLEMRIALRAKDLSSPVRYLTLAEFCLDNGRREEALRRAEEGLWMFEDGNPDMPLVLFVANLLAKARRFNDAEAKLWEAFERKPALELYAALRSVTGSDARQRAVRFLENRLGESKSTERNGLSDVLIALFLREEMFDEAWQAATARGASPEVMSELALATDATHPHEVLRFCESRIEELAETGGAASYKELVSLLARMASLQGPALHASYIAALKSRFVRKRSLLRHLP